MIDATNRLSTDLASAYPSKGPIVGDAATASGEFNINGTLLTARINDNRTFQIYAQIAGGTAIPEYYARSSHTSTGGGGWTALQRLWHSGNQLALGTTAAAGRSALGLGTMALASTGDYLPRANGSHTLTATTDYRIAGGTAEGADTLQLRLQSGGAFSTSRGALFELNGVNAAANAGGFRLLGAPSSASVINGGVGSTVTFQSATYIYTSAVQFESDPLVTKTNAVFGVGVGGTRNGGIANYGNAGVGQVGLFSEHAGGTIFLRPEGRTNGANQFLISSSGFSWNGNAGWHAGNFNPGDYVTVAGAQTVTGVKNFAAFTGFNQAAPVRRIHLVGSSGPLPSTPGALGALHEIYYENNGNANITLGVGDASLAGLNFVVAGDSAGAGRMSLTWSGADGVSRWSTGGSERIRIVPSGRVEVPGEQAIVGGLIVGNSPNRAGALDVASPLSAPVGRLLVRDNGSNITIDSVNSDNSAFAPLTFNATSYQFNGGQIFSGGSAVWHAGNLAAGASVLITGGVLQRAALTGDVTANAGSNATTIANSAVTNAKMASMAAGTIKGRTVASGAGAPQDLTAAQARTLLELGTMALESTANFVDVGNPQTVGGAKTFTSSVTAPTFRASTNSFIGGGTFAVLATATGTGAAGQAFLRPDGESSAVGQLAVDLSGVSWGGNTVWHAGNFNPAAYATIATAWRTGFYADGPRSNSINVDLNGARGFHSFYANSSSANRPVGGNGFVWGLGATLGGTEYTVQEWGRASRRFFRTEDNSVWGSWHEYYHTGNFNPASKQDALGFTPVQQGGGIGQGGNKVYIGWAAGDILKATVDATDLGAFAMQSRNNTFSGSNVFTGGFLINRRDIPRLYLESPNQTNGYILDSNVSNSVFGNLRFLRRDNSTVLAELNNAGDFVAARTVLGRDLISRGGTTGTQQIFRTMAYSDGIARLYDVMEADGAYSLYLLDSAGNPAPNAYLKFIIAQDARQVQFMAHGIVLAPTARSTYQPDALVGHTTDLPNNIVANLSANYHNNNLLGVSAAAGVYHASDAGFTWFFKSGATWRQVMNILIGGTGASVFNVDGTVNDVAGNVRDVPPILRNSTTAFALSDRGRYIYKNNTTAYTWAVNTSVWVAGMTVSVSNRGTAGNVTISRGSGMVLRSGATDVASFALLPGQTRTLLAVSATEVHIL